MTDSSAGWEAVADRFVAVRSGIGTSLVSGWAERHIAPGATILDIGCGHGMPIAQALVDNGYRVAGVDASPRLAAAFARRFPDMAIACEPAQTSHFFHRRHPGIIAIGFLFLLDAAEQPNMLRRMARALEPGGRLLVSVPREACVWRDTLTGRESASLGAAAYEAVLKEAGVQPVGWLGDEGGNAYLDAAGPV